MSKIIVTMFDFEMPKDPVELAAQRAEGTVDQRFDMDVPDETLLAELDYAATELGFLGTRYFLSAHVGFQIPANFSANEPVTFTKFEEGHSAEAVLATHAKVHIGRLIGGGAVRAVCLCFSEGIVLNRFTEIPEDQLLYVPVLAVSDISEAA